MTVTTVINAIDKFMNVPVFLSVSPAAMDNNVAQLHVCEQFISYEFNVNGGGLWCMLVGYGSMLAMGQRVERHNIWWNNIASITIRNSYS